MSTNDFWSLVQKHKKKLKEEYGTTSAPTTTSTRGGSKSIVTKGVSGGKTTKSSGGSADDFWALVDSYKAEIAPTFVDPASTITVDIAPVGNPANPYDRMRAKGEDDWSKDKDFGKKLLSGWFQKGAFEDGYDIGDVTKTILGTGQDISENLYTGIIGMGEKVVDAGAYLAGGVGGLFGADEFQDDMGDFIKKDLYDEKKVAQSLTKYTVANLLGGSDNSVLDEKSDSLVQSGGQLLATAGLQMAGVPWFVTSGVTSFGGEAEGALNEGASYGEAGLSAAISAGAEILTEKLFGGSGLGEKGLINLEPLTKGISNKLVKTLADYGIDMFAESAEEVVSQFASNLGSALYKEDNLVDILFSEEAIDEYIQSAIGGGVLGGGMNVGNVASSIKSGRDYRTGLTVNEETVANKAVKDRIAERETNGTKLTKKERATIEAEVARELEKGGISTDFIESLLDEEGYKAYTAEKDKFFQSDIMKSYNDALASEESRLQELQAELDKLADAPNTVGNNKRYDAIVAEMTELQENPQSNSIKAQLDEEVKRINGLHNDLRTKVHEMVKGTKLAESYNELIRSNQKYTPDLNQYKNEHARKTIENILKSGMGDNTTHFKEHADWLAKISEDKGMSFSLTNDEALRGTEHDFSAEGLRTNAFVTDDGITLNMDSPKALNSTVGHEITHVLEKTELYQTLQDTVFNYEIARNGQDAFDKRLKAIEARYKGKNADARAELTADLIGDYLFTDYDFVHKLSTENRNVFQKIYDEIKYLCKVVTAGSKEARELEKVKRAFEDAYRVNVKGKADGKTQHSLGYHAGDLGKSEGYHMMSGSRSTGHFGTGTYFVGDEAKINDSYTYGKRPHEAVEFDNYNLYKVRNDKDGYRLHDYLHTLDSGVPQHFLDAAISGKFKASNLRSDAYELAEKYETKEWDDELEIETSGNFYEASIRAMTEVAQANDIEVKNYDEWLSEQSDDVPKPGDSDYELYQDEYYEYLKDLLVEADNERNSGYSKFRDAHWELRWMFGEDNVNRALQAVIDHQTAMEQVGYKGQYGQDSRATVFMKSLGYEGIDVRGTGLDNTTYGSVIYDLKGKDLERKNEIGTAKYSLSESEIPLEQRLSGDDLLDAQDLIAEIENVAEVSPNGYVTVYHRTTEENAKRIMETGKMSAKEDGIFFSTQKDGAYSSDYGKGVVTLKVPAENLVLDDIFDAEAHLRIPLKSRNEVLDVSKYMPASNGKANNAQYSLSSISNTFFGDENMTSEEFMKKDYRQTQGYKTYVGQCLNNFKQTRRDFDEIAAKQEIEDSIEGIVKVAIAAKMAGYDIQDTAVRRDAKDSKKRLLFSSLEPNSEYLTSHDISTICDKRKNFAEIYDEIVKAEEAKGVPQDKRFFSNVDNYFYLHKLMADKGLTQPCRQCYVESMRKNLAPMANAFLRLVGETNPGNTLNDQLYHQKGKQKGEQKTNNVATRNWVLEKLAEYDMTVGDLTVEKLTTEDGLAQLKLQAPLVYEAFNSFYGQSKPKMPKSATPFRFGELTALLTDEKGRIKKSLIDKINSTGGFRLQSYSDFQIQNYTDVLQVLFEAGTLGLNGHAYTKVPAFLDATEGTNLKRNISIFMYKDGNEWKLDRNDSFPYTLEEIYDIVKADKTGNTGIIAVSQNADMSAWIMANDLVGYGIPFHKSGLKMGTVRDTVVREDGREIKGYTGTKDHTKQQTEVWAKAAEDHKALTKVKKGINIYSFWDFDNKANLSKNELIEKNVRAYIDACEMAGYLPKFREYVMNNGKVLNDVLRYSKELGYAPQDATIEDISFEYKGYRIPYGYYKFLGDFGMFTTDGQASPQETLSLKDYDFDKAVRFFYGSETLRRNEILQQFANGEERQRYRDSNLTAEQLSEIVKQKRREVADGVVSRHSLSDMDEAPTKFGDWNVYGSDFGAKDDSFAPVIPTANRNVLPGERQSVSEMFPDEPDADQTEYENLVSVKEATESRLDELSALDLDKPELADEFDRVFSEWTEAATRVLELENGLSEQFDSLSDADAPPEMEAPVRSGAEYASNPFADRDWYEVGKNRRTQAFMRENPDFKPFFQEEALNMLGDLGDSQKAERWYNDELHYESGGEKGFGGQKRFTSQDIEEMLDQWGMTYDQIREGLTAIAEDNDNVNKAAAKRIEFMLNQRLLNGYKDFHTGKMVKPNQAYLDMVREWQHNQQASENFDSFMENADQYAPMDDIAPVMPTETPLKPATPDTQNTPVYPSTEPGAVRGQTTMFAPEKPATNGKVAEVLTKGSKKPKQGGVFHKAVAAVVDKGAVFEKVSLDSGNMEVQSKWQYALPTNTEARAQYFMENGENGVKSLKSVMKEVNKAKKTDAFQNYLYHVHNIDRMTLEDRFGVPNKAVYGDSVTADISRKKAARLEKQNPEFRRWAQDIYNINKQVRGKLVEGGLISQEVANLWEQMYPHYVPITRVDQNGANVNVPLDTNKTGVNAPVKRATGGNSNIEPLFNTMAQRIEQTYRAIARNSFGVELKNTLGTELESKPGAGVDEMIDTIEMQEELLKQGGFGLNPTFTVFENGERVEFEITEDMYDALKPANKVLAYRNPLITGASNFRRNLLTVWNPVFALYRNPIKDIQDVAINSQHPLRTYANVPNAIIQMLTNGEMANEYHKNGGKSNTYFDSRKNEFKPEDNIFKKVIGMPVRAIETAGEFIEEIPRLAEYIASRKDGRSIERSMLDAARVTTNFAAGGDFTKFLNSHGCTFLNASVQGAAQHVRNFREATKLDGFKGFTKTLAKYVIAGVPAMLLNGLLWDDDEEYEELSDYVKQNYYVVAKTDDGKFVRIPKGRTAAVMSEVLEQMENLVTGDDEADFSTFFELFLNNIAPNNPLKNNILSPIAQAVSNNAWYEGDIVPTRLQDLPAEEQFDESTDSISKWLGEKTGWSPMKINYLLDQYSGGLGDTFLPMLTPEAESGDDSTLGNFLAPWKKEITTDKVLNNKNPGDFYDLKDELEVISNGKNATEEDKMRALYMDTVSWEMGDLYAQKREIQSSDLPNDRKYEQVRQLQEQINELAKNAMGNYENVSIDGLYSEVGDKRFNLDADSGNWYEIKSTNADGSANWYYQKEQEVTKALGISYGEYWNNREEYNFAYDKPEQYTFAKAVGGYDSYMGYHDVLENWKSDSYIRADKDENGKSISGSRKEKIIDYLNDLDADYGEKIILFKSQYPSDDTYNQDIFDYINDRDDLSYDEKVSIFKYLEFDVDSDGYVRW